MVTQSNSRLCSWFKSFSAAAAAAVLLVGCLALVGWLLDIPALKSVRAGLLSMKANAALAFILAGGSLWLLRTEQADRRARRIAQVCACAVALVGLLTLGEYLLGRDFGIDQLLFRDTEVAPRPPGRMAISVALSFLMVGLALLLLALHNRRGHLLAQILALTAALPNVLALTGYAYDVASLYSAGAYSAVALHAASAFVLLCLGILFARPDRALMAVLTSDSAGGYMARRLLLAVIITPPLLGWLILAGQRAGLYDSTLGLSLLAVSSIAVFVVVISFNARSLHQIDVQRRQAEEERARLAGEQAARAEAEAARERIVSILESITDAFFALNREWRFTYLNKEAERLLQKTREQLMGKCIWDEFPEAVGSTFHHEYHRAVAEQVAVSFQEFYPPLDGWFEVRAYPARAGLSVYFRDVTERHQAEEEIKRLNADLRRRATELDATNKELEAFSYSVSHDLRAPLRGIDGFSQALLEDYADKLDEQGKDYLQRMRTASQRMAQTIDDLLNLSRITRSQMRHETVDLSAMAQEIATELQKTQPEREAQFIITPGLLAIGDVRLLRIALSNLLGNAWKFTGNHPRARIEFGVTEHEGRPAFFVRDDGVGFDMAYAGKLFGAFQRLHAMNEFPGTGVGLATVQRIIHRHGGRVWAEGAVEKGATFYWQT